MTVLHVNPVLGELPRLANERLPDQAALSAIDCDFSRGDIRVLPHAQDYQGNQVGHSFYMDQSDRLHAFSEAGMVVIPSPVAEESYDRFYCCSPSSGLQVKSGVTGELSRVGVPVPAWQADKPFLKILNSFTDEQGIRGPIRADVYLVGSVWWENAAGVRHHLVNVNVSELSDFKGSNDAVKDAYSAEFVLQLKTGEWASVASDMTLCAVLVGMKRAESITLESGGILISDRRAVTVGSLYSSSSLRAETSKPAKVFGSDQVTGTVRFDTVTDFKGNDQEVVVFSVSLGVVDARAYLVTAVNDWGEESRPSKALSVSLADDEDARLQFTHDHLLVPDGYRPIVKLRIYRSALTSNSLSDYFYLDSVSLDDFSGGTFLYLDKVSETDHQDDTDVLSTEDYYPAPDQLQGVGLHPSGFLFAWKGAELWFSEPYLPYAWKPGNVLTLNADIVVGRVHAGAIFCATKGYPELVNGGDPEGLLPLLLSTPQACVNQQAITDAGNIIYASPDGLVEVSGGHAQLMQGHFTRRVWRERYAEHLSQLSLAIYDGALYGLFPDRNGFVMRLDEGKALTQTTLKANQLQYHPSQDQLFLYQVNRVRVVGEKGRTATIHAKCFQLVRPQHLNCFAVKGRGAIDVVVMASDQELVRYNNIFKQGNKEEVILRIPAGFRSMRWSLVFHLEAEAVLVDCAIASSARLLKYV